MKLIFAIVNGDDSHRVSKSLTAAGFFATRLASTGGFLSSGNTTFLICTESEKVQSAPESGSATFPVEVSVGGATIFVTDVERFEKV